MKKLLNLILKSSADPKKTSLTVKMALLAIVPWAMQAIGLVCAIGYTCISLDQSLLEAWVTAISELVFYGLSTISIIGTVWGATRKVGKTLAGTNPNW